jgi:hypothetical protein
MPPNIRSSSAHNLIQAIVLKPAILWQLLDFFKNSRTLDLSKIYKQSPPYQISVLHYTGKAAIKCEDVSL